MGQIYNVLITAEFKGISEEAKKEIYERLEEHDFERIPTLASAWEMKPMPRTGQSKFSSTSAAPIRSNSAWLPMPERPRSSDEKKRSNPDPENKNSFS